MIPQKLLLLVTSLSLASATTIPRGVSPEDAKLYAASAETFTCLTHPTIQIPLSRVNDDFCDCPDGSDEPGTSACANLPHKNLSIPGFYCANIGHMPAFLPVSRVNDGVCDYDICCDGSDEWAGVGGVKCPSRCAEIGKAARKMAAEKHAARSKAAKSREELVRKAAVLKRELQDGVAATKTQIAANKVKVAGLKKKLAETEEMERRRAVRNPKPGSRVAVLTSAAKEKSEELRALLKKLREQRDLAEEKLHRTEAILRKFKEEYNPNFNDEGVKSADRDMNAVMEEEVDWEEIAGPEPEEAAKFYQLTQYLPSTAQEWLSTKITEARELLVSNGILAPQKTEGFESAAVAAARDALTAAEREDRDSVNSLADLEKSLTTDFGPSDVFRALKGVCITRQFGEYDYELCFMEKATQKSRKDNGRQNLGSFAAIEMVDETSRNEAAGVFASSWEENHDEPLSGMVLKHDNGAQCWNGPKRSVAVELYCCAENEIRNVVEMEKCVYRMEVGTPAACKEQEAKNQERAKDEL
ncbi:glucosidase II beta subunit-like-domain-containing protein [Sphaerosporella brunnea]|uniref:Glucosidase 2 subunit beta n=1 Tax=Sphaerosporella brunnea TaxID=1250544 RepID=A0A5J5F022_9PEZI|nr:glucosidase II beta subunit-like-domain-containing protein [Sphaerosporella brunnea]